MDKLDINMTILSREKSMPIPKYEKGEPRIFNGKDLNSSEFDFIYGGISVKPGQFFLYEKIEEGAVPYLSYPRLGIFLNYLACDQTIEVEWFDVRRTWEFRVPCREYDIYGKEYEAYVCDMPSEIKRMILWNDSMNVYGAWNGMPSWKELRRAYEKTIWFGKTIEQERDQKLGSILR